MTPSVCCAASCEVTRCFPRHHHFILSSYFFFFFHFFFWCVSSLFPRSLRIHLSLMKAYPSVSRMCVSFRFQQSTLCLPHTALKFIGEGGWRSCFGNGYGCGMAANPIPLPSPTPSSQPPPPPAACRLPISTYKPCMYMIYVQ